MALAFCSMYANAATSPRTTVKLGGMRAFKFQSVAVGDDAYLKFKAPSPAEMKAKVRDNQWPWHPTKGDLDSTSESIFIVQRSNIQKRLNLATGHCKRGGLWSDAAWVLLRQWCAKQWCAKPKGRGPREPLPPQAPATMFGTVDGSALISALHAKSGAAFDKYQMAKMRLSEASAEARVRMLECEKAKESWLRCFLEEASAALAEFNRKPRVKEEREEGIGGHAQDHEGEEEIQATMKLLETAKHLLETFPQNQDQDSQADLKELEENQMPVTPTSFTPDPTPPTAGTDQDTDRRRAARSRIPPQRSTPDPERPSAIAFPPTLTQAQQDEFRARYPHGIPQTPSSTPRREITAEQRAQRQQME